MRQLTTEWKLFAQSCLALCNSMHCSPPGSSVHEILQARVPEWVAIPFSRGSSWPIEPGFPALQSDSLPSEHWKVTGPASGATYSFPVLWSSASPLGYSLWGSAICGLAASPPLSLEIIQMLIVTTIVINSHHEIKRLPSSRHHPKHLFELVSIM